MQNYIYHQPQPLPLVDVFLTKAAEYDSIILNLLKGFKSEIDALDTELSEADAFDGLNDP